MALTFDLSNDIGKVRELVGDTNIASAETAMFTDEEIQFYLDRWGHVADQYRPDWAFADLGEHLLVNDARLVGKSTILGVALDGTAWRDALHDAIKTSRQRHILGPS